MYLVAHTDYDSHTIVGIFSTEAKALKAREMYIQHQKDIVEADIAHAYATEVLMGKEDPGYSEGFKEDMLASCGCNEILPLELDVLTLSHPTEKQPNGNYFRIEEIKIED